MLIPSSPAALGFTHPGSSAGSGEAAASPASERVSERQRRAPQPSVSSVSMNRTDIEIEFGKNPACTCHDAAHQTGKTICWHVRQPGRDHTKRPTGSVLHNGSGLAREAPPTVEDRTSRGLPQSLGNQFHRLRPGKANLN